MSEEKNTKSETPRKKLTEEEKKARQKEWTRAWYLRKKAAKGKGPAKKKKQKQGDIFYLFWMFKKDEMFQEVVFEDAENDAQEILSSTPSVQEIYLMEPTKLYNRGTIKVTDL